MNPDFAVKGSGMRMGGGPQQFGVDAERVPELLKELAAGGLDLLGFHIFAGSQNLRAEILVRGAAQTVELALRLAEHVAGAGARTSTSAAGSASRTSRRTAARPRRRSAQNLDDLIERRDRARAARRQACVIELGRYLVGEAGVYVTRVVDRKESRGKMFLVVDGGMHHQLAASGNFGQVIRRNYPLASATAWPRSRRRRPPWSGCLCTPLDLLGDNVACRPRDIGDLVVTVPGRGLRLTASPTAFLSHPAPAEVLV